MTVTTKQDIEGWFDEGVAKGATHMISATHTTTMTTPFSSPLSKTPRPPP
jgi:hypothetical protein